MEGAAGTEAVQAGESGEWPPELLACPNPDCPGFNRFAAGNLSVCERMGKGKRIRRLYCSSCGTRFSERSGTLLEGTELPPEKAVQIVKCLALRQDELRPRHDAGQRRWCR